MVVAGEKIVFQKSSKYHYSVPFPTPYSTEHINGMVSVLRGPSAAQTFGERISIILFHMGLFILRVCQFAAWVIHMGNQQSRAPDTSRITCDINNEVSHILQESYQIQSQTV